MIYQQFRIRIMRWEEGGESKDKTREREKEKKNNTVHFYSL